MTVALHIATYTALASTALFVLGYARVRWWVTPVGRSIMALALALLLLEIGAVLRRLGALDAADDVITAGWTSISIVMPVRLRQMLRIQSQGRRLR